MRIHQVQITGFGPFHETQIVDLDQFADHGIFVITGRTGAGKSSILDAIVYALYDSAPRYGNSGGRQLRSDHCAPGDPTRVELIFSAGGQTYRIVRTPEYVRPKARGAGLTTEKPTAELSRREGDQWVGIASQLRTVGEELHQILPLRCDQFLQVMLLAQGQFQKFLVASSDERQKLLRTLFNSDRFTDYDTVMQQRAAALRHELAQADSGVSATIQSLAQHAGRDVPDTANDEWLTAILDAHDTDVEVARDELDQASKELQAAQEALQEATDLAGRQRRFAEATALLAEVVAHQDAVRADRVRHDRGVAALSVVPAHAAVRKAVAEADQASTALAAARVRFADVVQSAPPADVSGMRDELSARLAVLTSRLADEQELQRLTSLAERRHRELGELAAAIEEIVQQRELHAGVLDVEPEISAEQVRVDLAGLRDELERSTKLVTARERLERAELDELRCGRALTAASTMLDALRERRLADQAGVLAQELREGQPCAVCGATEHPQPATHTGEPVTREMLDSARAELDAATEQARRSGDVVVSLRTTIDGLDGVRPVAELTDLVDQTALTLAATEQAERARKRARAEHDRLAADQQQHEVRRAALAQEAKGVTAQVDDLRLKVEQARGDAGSVTEQIQAVTDRVEACTELIAAQSEVETTDHRRTEAQRMFAQMLEHHGFADEQAFVGARIDQSVIDELARRIEIHDKALARAESTLGEPELRELPDEPADVPAAREAQREAQTVHEAASETFGVVRARAGSSLQLASSIRRGWASSARTRASFEVLDRLAKSLHGESPNLKRMRLESYVLAAELEQIVRAANVRLRVMSSGRYVLQRSTEVASRGTNAGLEVRVLDEYTGEIRSPESLSGGEKFLASLALALGLAEVVTNRSGGITLDTLFIDEGFGSLDSETLDIAMHTLDSLRENGRTIGLISHVESMKERVPAQLVVDTSPRGTSSVELRA